MPPKPRARKPLQKGYDPTSAITSVARVKAANLATDTEKKDSSPEKNTSDDLKKLIETLKTKMGVTQGNNKQKQSPPVPQKRAVWNRSMKHDWNAKPAYTVLTRISNHELVPTRLNKSNEVTVNSLPHSFLYRPGIDGIKVDKLNIKSGKQISWG